MALGVFLLDDHEIVRHGLRGLLERAGIRVVAEAGTCAEALALVDATHPDVAVLDMRLPDGDGVAVCRDIRSHHPDIACLMLTSFSDDESLASAVLAGAAGYVLKDLRGTDLVEAIRRVAAGESLFDSSVAVHVVEALRRPVEPHDGLEQLTDQERRVLDLIAEGLTNRQIGERMYLAEKTVKNYVSNLLAKLNMSRRAEAAAYAARLAERRRPY